MLSLQFNFAVSNSHYLFGCVSFILHYFFQLQLQKYSLKSAFLFFFLRSKHSFNDSHLPSFQIFQTCTFLILENNPIIRNLQFVQLKCMFCLLKSDEWIESSNPQSVPNRTSWVYGITPFWKQIVCAKLTHYKLFPVLPLVQFIVKKLNVQ